jgi:hypothetical protein
MVLVNVLKRRDGSSIIVAILVAMILLQPMNALTARLANWISGTNAGQYGTSVAGVDWKAEYLHSWLDSGLGQLFNENEQEIGSQW